MGFWDFVNIFKPKPDRATTISVRVLESMLESIKVHDTYSESDEDTDSQEDDDSQYYEND